MTMGRERLGGTVMIISVAMGLATMALHPTGHDIQRDPVFQGMLNLAVHSLAILGAPMALYGCFVLTRRLAMTDPVAELALAFYGVSTVATLMAATASGMLAPALIGALRSADPDASAITLAILRYNVSLNQAFAKIIVGTASIAIGLWSYVIVRRRVMNRRAGIYGCVIAVLALLALLSGQLRMDIHGFGAIVLAHGIWMVVIGLELRRSGPAEQHGSSERS